MSVRGTGRLFASTALAVGAVLLSATTALAAPPAGPPNPADPRATAHAGNAVTCEGAGLTGTTIVLAPGQVQNITVTDADIPADDTLLAVVVKGGDNYNIYQGLTSWTDLHSPLNGGGNIPTISHAFACVTGKPATNPLPSPSGKQSTSPPSGTATAPVVVPGGGTTASTTNAAGVAAAGTPGGTGKAAELPNTGLGDGWLIWVAGTLLLAGGGTLAFTRFGRRRTG